MLVTTLTKRMAEDLTEYYHDLGVKVDTCIPISTRSSVRKSFGTSGGAYSMSWSVIHLLREGLDIPEVSLVAFLMRTRKGI